MSEQLKPCPFCGGNNVELVNGDISFWINCVDCFTEGPLAEIEEQAKDKWNTRASTWHPIRTEADLPKEEYISYLVQVKECPTAHDIQEWHEGMKKYWLEHFSAYQPLPEPYRPEEGEK